MPVKGSPSDASFWAQFVGATPGARGAEFAALCSRGTDNEQWQVVGRLAAVAIARQAQYCELRVGAFAPDYEDVDPIDPDNDTLSFDARSAVAALDKIVETWGPGIDDPVE